MRPRLSSRADIAALRCAFTLVELLVVIATLAVLGMLVVPALAGGKGASLLAQCSANAGQVTRAYLMYAADNSDVLPWVKWRPGNPRYPAEMMRLVSNVPGAGYDTSGGPYNLGQLWTSRLITDGRLFYCPANVNATDTYDFYAYLGPWPYGFNTAVIDKNTIRSGFTCLPQLVPTTTVTTLLGVKACQQLPGDGDYNNNPDPTARKWICLAPYKLSTVDVKHTLMVDATFDSGNVMGDAIPHHNLDGSIAGVNAAFPDGHVVWQGTNRVPAAFHPQLWSDIGNNNGNALRHVIAQFAP